MRSRSLDALTVLGLAGPELSLYRRLRPHSGRPVEDVARALAVEPAALPALVERLTRAGVVRLEDGVVVVPPPAQLLHDVVTVETDQLRDVVDRLDRLRASLPSIRGLIDDPVAGPGLPESELRAGAGIHEILKAWVRESTGGLMWLRPDQWLLPQESEMSVAVREALANGQRSRAIYPARVLEEAPASLFERLDAGEEVRLVADLPSRMAVVADVGALIPEEWGIVNERRLLLRQPAMMAALATLFEELWARAVVVPGGRTADLNRRMLLEQLARGARDEQIARTLGLSLRTVRRRIADLLVELGVETRFQAGIEAVRRGWI
ncbi:helix-turn-helix domain-containing protein [Nocardioides jensenii]|uniref:hypothetical protein n=1 Tax=Nocardioides jensenii TaxID=1843 RepID=UPI0008330047|nr:hypothetical protein [Nocardioides jensenii]